METTIRQKNVGNKDLSFFEKFVLFTKEVFEPFIHIMFSIIWFLGLYGSLVLVVGEGRSLIINVKVILGITSLLLVLYYMRVADEAKDVEYDREYNPDRPTSLGIINYSDMKAYMIMAGILCVIVTSFISQRVLLIVTLNLIYTSFLIWIDEISESAKGNMYLNLIITYPINIILCVFIYVFFLDMYGAQYSVNGILMVAAFACNFLHYEFERKLCPLDKRFEGRRLYSNDLGAFGALFFVVLFGVATNAILLMVFEPWNASGITAITGWLPLITLVPMFAAILKFFKIRKEGIKGDKPNVLTAYGTVFIVLFYSTLIINAFAGCSVVFRL